MRRDGSLASPRAARSTKAMARMRFKGEKPASAEELSDAGRAAPDTAHAAAAGRRAPTGSHTPPRRAELALVAERESEAGSPMRTEGKNDVSSWEAMDAAAQQMFQPLVFVTRRKASRNDVGR